MRIELPDPPASFGCSRRVQRRVRESIPAVRVAFASLEILGEAIERRWGDRMPRASSASGAPARCPPSGAKPPATRGS